MPVTSARALTFCAFMMDSSALMMCSRLFFAKAAFKQAAIDIGLSRYSAPSKIFSLDMKPPLGIFVFEPLWLIGDRNPPESRYHASTVFSLALGILHEKNYHRSGRRCGLRHPILCC